MVPRLKDLLVRSRQWAKRQWAWAPYRAGIARAWMMTVRYDRRLRSFYRGLAGGRATGVRKQPFRGADIIRQLRRCAPRYICELGSGSSTGVFASYVERHDAQAVAFEHDSNWREVTLEALRLSGLDTGRLKVTRVDTRVDERGVGYASPVPDDADFVYVDGPPSKDDGGRNFACVDVLEALERGARPGTIMVDGRKPTVAALREHPVVQTEYEAVFAREDGRADRLSWREALVFRPHHVFTLRDGHPQTGARTGESPV